MWFRWMALAFAFNGVCTFGIRILAANGNAKNDTATYLLLWYFAGALLLGGIALAKGLRPRRVEMIVGAALGVASVAGQGSIGMALAKGLPGSVVYPVALAGGLFLVIAAGIVIFHERVGRFGMLGIALGIASIVLLSL